MDGSVAALPENIIPEQFIPGRDISIFNEDLSSANTVANIGFNLR